MKVKCRFTISYDSRNQLRPSSNTVFAASADDVDWFGRVSGFAVITQESKALGIKKSLQVECDEGAPELAKLLLAIEQKYRFKVYPGRYVPVALRDTHFGVLRIRTFSHDEIENADLLCLGASNAIASHKDRTSEQIARECYVAEKSPKSGWAIGSLMPFGAIAVEGELKLQLEACALCGLNLRERVVNTDNLWKMASDVVLPRCKVPLVTGSGQPVENFDTWDKFESRFFDDGHEPPILVYCKEQIGSLGVFDIAVTAERTGQGNGGAYRCCVVSQKFRRVMTGLRVSGVRYTPVRVL